MVHKSEVDHGSACPSMPKEVGRATLKDRSDKKRLAERVGFDSWVEAIATINNDGKTGRREL